MTTVIVGEQGVGRHESEVVAIAAMTPDDRDAVAAMFRRCSVGALRHRFHGFTDGMAYLDRQLNDSEVVLIAWRGTSCIGLGALAADGDGPWHIGVLVEDSWQRCGLGTRLLANLILEAQRRRVSVIRADVLVEDGFILKLLRRMGTVTTNVSCGTITADVRIAHQGHCADA